jgi:F0F1-type ATP synthase assembly protein I
MGFNLKYHREWAANLTIVMQLGLTMVGSIALCFLIGRSLDRWLNTKGVFIAIFTILGVIGGAVTCYRQIQEIVERDQKNRKPQDGE